MRVKNQEFKNHICDHNFNLFQYPKSETKILEN